LEEPSSQLDSHLLLFGSDRALAPSTSTSLDSDVHVSSSDVHFSSPSFLDSSRIYEQPFVTVSDVPASSLSSMEIDSDEVLESDERDSESEQEKETEELPGNPLDLSARDRIASQLGSLSLLLRSCNQISASIAPQPSYSPSKRKRDDSLDSDDDSSVAPPPTKRPKKSSGVVKQFACGQCDKSYCRKGDLGRHQKVAHSKNSPQHSCNQCSQMFTLRGNLARHMRTVHGPKMFRCSVCSQEFTQQTDLDRHGAIHTDSRRFQCPACDKKFLQKAHMQYHYNAHHVKKGKTCKL